ncbi:hypothetical protein Q31a_31720 [Aureliella helgolandensis]|uniref:Uncharacterized protein n=1 Tax=Aureliella helgolandensis TaxID=2527968 RepID=A0A518G8D6_9BACT|nr:hypothetical protein Q31a_31720 [Aureliella helgolandensis]
MISRPRSRCSELTSQNWLAAKQLNRCRRTKRETTRHLGIMTAHLIQCYAINSGINLPPN